MQDSPDSPRVTRWIDIIRQYLLPGISLLDGHTVSALEIWNVLQLLPIEKRYGLYGEWKDTMYRRIPALSVRKAEAERDVKSILRRLSTENVKKFGKTLAKAVHTNPTIIFNVVLNQVQSYDNLIVPVVEAARYLTEFGYDVMTYSLLDALSSDKEKTKEDGTSTALWLQGESQLPSPSSSPSALTDWPPPPGLATFAGQLYRRWAPMSGSIWLVLQYLVNQLSAGNSKDLIVLRELISRMTGFEPFADLSDAQVMSLAGGKLLRSEVFTQTDISQASKRITLVSLQNAKGRLTQALQKSGLAMPLLVSIAVQRQACISTVSAHLKSLGGLFDQVRCLRYSVLPFIELTLALSQCHAVLFQYLEFLAAALDPDELANLVPPVHELIGNFEIDAAIAFDIARPKLRLAIRVRSISPQLRHPSFD